MNILIAGNTGVIGSYLNKQDRFANSLVLNSKIVDLTSKEEIYSYVSKIEKFSVLIFLVGLAHSKGKNKHFSNFEKINYTSLKNLLSVLEYHNKLPKKIIFSSTISVYGENINTNVYSESTKPLPFSPYAKTKLMAENYLLDNYNSESWILRFSPVYYDKFMLNINRRTKILNKYFCVGSGEQNLSLCNINNIIESINGILNDNVPNGVYNISDSKIYSYNDLLNIDKPNKIIRIPKVLILLLYYFSKLIKNNFLKENSIKLYNDNIYPNNKINKFVKLSYSLKDIKK